MVHSNNHGLKQIILEAPASVLGTAIIKMTFGSGLSTSFKFLKLKIVSTGVKVKILNKNEIIRFLLTIHPMPKLFDYAVLYQIYIPIVRSGDPLNPLLVRSVTYHNFCDTKFGSS